MLRDHQRPLHRHAAAILRDEDAALDVMQTSMFVIARRLGTLRDPRWFRAWAYRIVTREAVRAASRRGRERALFDDDARVETMDRAAIEPVDSVDLVRRCTDMIERLPPSSGLVVRLHYQDGLTLVEIAEALELPLGTVKSRLAYGLARLREMAGKHEQHQRRGTNG